MADYSSDDISNLYATLLGINSGNVSGALKTIQDGDGNDTALQLSSAGVKSTGTLASTGAINSSSTITGTAVFGSARGMSNVFGADISVRSVSSGAAIIDTTDELIEMSGTTSSLTLIDPTDMSGRVVYVVNLTSGSISIDFAGQTILNNGASSTSGLSVRGYTGQAFYASASGVWVLLSGTLT